MEDYLNACKFSQTKNITKKDIFMYANKNNNKSSILGLIDGLILRDNDLNVMNGLVKQFKELISDDDIVLSIEHACLSHCPEHVKTLCNFITFPDLLIDSYDYIKEKNPDCLKYINPYILKNLNSNISMIQDDKDNDKYIKNYEESQSYYEQYEQSEYQESIDPEIKEINIFINNLNINLVDPLELSNYFQRITKANILEL